MSADLYVATTTESGETSEAKELSYDLPVSAAQVGLPKQLKVELFPGVDPEPGNPLAAKNCRIVVRGLARPDNGRNVPAVIKVRDHKNREVGVKEVRSCPDVAIPLGMLREAIPYSDLKIEIRPIKT